VYQIARCAPLDQYKTNTTAIMNDGKLPTEEDQPAEFRSGEIVERLGEWPGLMKRLAPVKRVGFASRQYAALAPNHFAGYEFFLGGGAFRL
jgi:hypothetical protein